MRKLLFLLGAICLIHCDLLAQQVKLISGRVADDKGTVIPFASVVIKGTRQGAVADADGNYTIKAKTGDKIVVSGAGIATTEIIVKEGKTMDIVVIRREGALTDVVITAQGVKRETKALGYAVGNISSDVLNISKPVNVAQGLIGQVSGAQVSVINNGVDPQVRIQLRGERHVYADNQPLLIVDGMEVDITTYLSTINPEDVSSVSVLKGASAAALYGSEASNGVMIITTKKGTGSTPTINFAQTVTAERLAYAPKLQDTYSGYGGETGVLLAGTPYAHDAVNPFTGFTNYVPFENQSYGPAFNGNPLYAEIGLPNQFGQFDTVPFQAQSKNILKQFFVTGFTKQTDLSLTSGDSKNSNFLSVQYVNVKGITPDDRAQRANVRIGGKRTFGIFSYDYALDYGYKYTNVVGNDITAGWPIYWTLLNTPANIPVAALKNWQDPTSWGNLSNYYNAYYINPWWQIENSRDVTRTDLLQGSVNLYIRPTNWLTASYGLSLSYNNSNLHAFRNEADFSPYSQAAALQYGTYGTPLNGNIAGALENSATLTKRLQQDIRVTMEHKFGDIQATLILGNTIWDRYINEQIQSVGNSIGTIGGGPQGQTSNLILPKIYDITYISGIVNNGSPFSSNGGDEGIEEIRLVGGYADLSLGYKDQLFLNGNFRKDYSSLLAPSNSSYSVFAVDGSWVFSSTIDALKTSSWLTYAKLRAAYSQTGQITVPAYATANTFNVTSPYPYGSLSSLTQSTAYNNPSLVPEGTKEQEYGFEFAILKNKFSAGVTYYTDNNYNQLFPVTTTSATGFTSAFVNAAKTASNGWEFDAKASLIRSRKFRWNVAGNLAIQSTIVKSLFNGTNSTGAGNSNEAIVGKEFPQLYVQDLLRDSANGKVIVNSQGYPTLSNSYVAAGRTTPHYILGLTTNLSYGDFTLNVIADYRGGYVFFNSAEQNLDFTGASAHTAENGRQNFIYPNSEVVGASGKYVANTSTYTQDGNIGFWAYSQYRGAGTSYTENAAAWKVRTISLVWDASRVLGSWHKVIKGLKLSAICNNALMFRPKENDFTDPEFNASNSNGQGFNTYYQLPPTRQYTFVANFSF